MFSNPKPNAVFCRILHFLHFSIEGYCGMLWYVVVFCGMLWYAVCVWYFITYYTLSADKFGCTLKVFGRVCFYYIKYIGLLEFCVLLQKSSSGAWLPFGDYYDSTFYLLLTVLIIY